MRTFKQYFTETFDTSDYIKNISFKITDWNSDDKEFKAIVYGEMKDFRFYEYGGHAEAVDKIEYFYKKSKSARKTIEYIEQNFARLINNPQDKEIKITDKFVKCPKCGQATQMSGNRPGTTCPNCGEGILEPM